MRGENREDEQQLPLMSFLSTSSIDIVSRTLGRPPDPRLVIRDAKGSQICRDTSKIRRVVVAHGADRVRDPGRVDHCAEKNSRVRQVKGGPSQQLTS